MNMLAVTTLGAAVLASAETQINGRVGADPELIQISTRFTRTLAIHSNISGHEGDAKVALSHFDQSTGQFSDLNYSFTPYAHIGQPQSDHLARCNLFASLWISPLSMYYRSSSIKSAGLTCTQWYVNNNPPSTNWFMTQLWIPINVGQLLFIYGDQMPRLLATKAVQIMQQVDEKGPKDKSQGANAANVGRVHIMLGLLAGNRTAVASGFAAFYRNIKTNKYGPPVHSGEGIRPDFSFMQHGALLYNGVYGVSFAENLLRVAYQTAGTSFAMSDDAYTIMSSFILDGTQHMMMYPSLNWDISVIGRAYSYPEGQRSSIADLGWMIAEIGGNRSSEWIDFAGRLNHTVGDLSDSSHFWDYAQYTVHHRKNMFTVTQRMINTVTRSSETINEEGLVGFHLGDGATYVYLTGEEYFDIFPCWDFQLIPGTTVEYGTTCPVDHNVGHYGTTSTVGGASNGLATVAAWEFQAPSFPADKKDQNVACVQSLSYHRTTVFMQTCFVVLTTAMSSNTSSPVVTTLDSRALNGSVTVWSSVGGSAQILPRGSHAASEIKMLHHNSIGYLFPGKANVSIVNDAVVGNWTKLANRMTGNPTRDLFTATVQHGVKLDNVDFVYVVFPGVSAVQFPDLAQKYLADTTIIANSVQAQVIHVRANSSIATSAKGDFLAGMIFDNSTSVTSPYFGRVETFGASTAAFILEHHSPVSNASISTGAGPTVLADSSCSAKIFQNVSNKNCRVPPLSTRHFNDKSNATDRCCTACMYTPNCGYFEITNDFSKCSLFDQNASCTAVGVGKEIFGVYNGPHPSPTPPPSPPHPHPGPSPSPPHPPPSGPVGPPGPTDADSIVIAISDPRAGPVGSKGPGLTPSLVLSGVTVQEAAVNSYHRHYAPAYCSMKVSPKGALVGNFENKCAKAGGMCFGMSENSRASESLVAWCLTKKS